jgi:RNA polymerase sigma factor (sigma-70 family)
MPEFFNRYNTPERHHGRTLRGVADTGRVRYSLCVEELASARLVRSHGDPCKSRGAMSNQRESIWSHYLRQRHALVRFLRRRTRDPDLAEDLAQETWLRVSHGATSAAIENPRAYLFRIASNLATDHLRAEARRLLSDEELDALLSVPDDGPGPEAVAIGRSQLRLIADALAELPVRRRRILLMSRVEGRPHRAIAEHFCVSVRTVEFEIVRALTHCRARMLATPGAGFGSQRLESSQD